MLAVDQTTGAVLGAFLNEDYATADPPGFDAFLQGADGDWMPTLSAVATLEESFNAAFGAAPEDRKKGVFFHLWMIGVASHARGRGVGKKLAQYSLALAKARGFAFAFAECTGSTSTRIMVNHCNADVEHFVDYATSDYPVLHGLPDGGHAGMSLTVNRL